MFQPKTQLENLPQEMLSTKRFFPVEIRQKPDGRIEKIPLIKAWNELRSLMTAEDALKQSPLIGFVTSAINDPDPWLFFDFDHVLDDNGGIVDDEAERVVGDIQACFDNAFIERSISGHGLHFLAKPNPGKFERIASGEKGRLYFNRDKKIMLEIFYRTDGRYVLLTGDLYDDAGSDIPKGTAVDQFLKLYLDEIEERLLDDFLRSEAATDNTFLRNDSLKHDVPACAAQKNYDIFRAKRMLKILAQVDHKQITYQQWLAIQTACKTIGVPYEFVDEFNSAPGNGGNYHAESNLRRWAKLNNSGFSVRTLHGIAKNFGYIEKESRKIWFDQIRDSCVWSKDKQGSPVSIKPYARNLDKIFEGDLNLNGLIGYDLFFNERVLLRRPPWSKEEGLTDWEDDDAAQLKLYLRRNYAELKSDDLINDFIVDESRRNSFHPVKQFFNALPEWDGENRAATLFIKFLKAEDSPYTREVTLNWLTAAVARIFHPGCNYQIAPILLGKQGIGKSYLLEQLGGKWYGGLTDDCDDSHAIDSLQRMWIAEMKEMKSLRKDVRANKAFIDAAFDIRRKPYDRYATKTLRHSVLIVTSNENEMLSDATGNRRHPVIECHAKPGEFVEGLTDDFIKQVWAEVYAHYKELFKDGFDEKLLLLSKETRTAARDIAAEHVRDDGVAGEIRSYLDTKILPPALWHLLTREERHKFIADGRLVMFEAISEFNHRRRAKGGDGDAVQRDIDNIVSTLTKTQQKPWLRIEKKLNQGKEAEEFILYGSELRQHICATEIYCEAFGNDRKKSMARIAEVLANDIEGWELKGRLQNTDPAYIDQRKVYFRIKTE